MGKYGAVWKYRDMGKYGGVWKYQVMGKKGGGGGVWELVIRLAMSA